jgi:hypothetical protein
MIAYFVIKSWNQALDLSELRSNADLPTAFTKERNFTAWAPVFAV